MESQPPAPAEPKPESLSKQILGWSVDPQTLCPFYSDIPAEVRLLIFSYALEEEEVSRNSRGWGLSRVIEPQWLLRDITNEQKLPEEEDLDLEDFNLDYYVETDQQADALRDKWMRPGCEGWKTQDTSLLRTCRRIFIEARDMVMENATRRIFRDNYSAPPHFGKLGFDQDVYRMSHYTANRITKFQLYIPIGNLTHEYLSYNHLQLRSVKDLRLTFRKPEWGNDWTVPINITPYGTGRAEEMREHMNLTQDFQADDTTLPIPPIPFKHGYHVVIPWGEMFSKFPYLESLTMDFENSEERFSELSEIAEWAHRVWRFRLGGHMKGYYLSPVDTPVEKYSWRGLSSHWYPRCIGGGDHDDRAIGDGTLDPPSPCCVRRLALMEKGLGPRMYTFTVRWTAHKLDPAQGDDPNVFGPQDLPRPREELLYDGVIHRPYILVARQNNA